MGITLLCLLLYWLSILLTRWHHIAKSVHVMLEEQFEALSTRLTTEVEQNNSPEVQALQTMAADWLKRVKSWEPWSWDRCWDWFMWSRGRENAAWVAVHELERQLAAFLAPQAHVNPYLRWAHAELRVVNKPGAIAVADAIEAALKPCSDADRPLQQKNQKALLGRALAIINADRDAGFITLMEWQNKASWLIFAALLIILFLVAAAGNAVLFLAGAAGGYLSRVMRDPQGSTPGACTDYSHSS